MRSVVRLGAALALAAVMAAGAWPLACRTAESPADWLAELEAAHRQADAAVDSGDPAAAREVLRAFVDRPAPDGINAVDLRIVRQDLYHRLAELELATDHPALARTWAEHGLGLGRSGDLFEANLLTARGRAQERLGLDAEAADDFYEALRINERLLREQLVPEGSR